MTQSSQRFGRTIKLLSQRWRESEGDVTLEKSIVGLIARGQLSEKEGARWFSRLTTSPQLAAILRHYASGDWNEQRFKHLLRSYRSLEGGAPNESETDGLQLSPNGKIATLLVHRWDEIQREGAPNDDLANERAIVGLIARGELSDREGARWLSRFTTSPQFAAILRNYASDDWDDDRFKALFRAYKVAEGGGAASNELPPDAVKISPNDRIAKLLVRRWDDIERSGTAGDELLQEKSIVGLIARGELSEREGARWFSRLTKSPQLAVILRNYASDDWDDERFRALFRSYKSGGREDSPFGESIAKSSPDDKLASMVIERWRNSDQDLANEKAIVGVIARGQLSDREGARWLSRFTRSPQFSAILRHYASDDWNDDRFRELFRSYKISEAGDRRSEAARSPYQRVATLLVQRWENSSDELVYEKAIVSLIVRGQLSEKESARWLSRFVKSPHLARILRNYALGEWSEDRFSSIHRLLRDREDGAWALGDQADRSKQDKTVKMLADRWQDMGDEHGHEKTIVSLIARGQLTEREGARWLSRIVVSPHLAAVLRDYASDDWDEALFRQVFRIYRNPRALDDSVPEINEVGSSAAAKLAAQGRLGKKRKSSLSDTKYIVLNSFPKSGNTWVRQFLSCLCFDGDLNAVPDHYHQEISQAPIFKMPNGDSVRFYKSHDKTLPIIVDGRLIEHAGAIHIRRHPLDVFMSYLNFMHLSRIDSDGPEPRGSPFIIEAGDLSNIIGQDLTWAFFGVFMVFGTVNPKFQAAGSWFQNVEEWTGLKDDLPLVSLKYESLIENGADDLMELGEMLGKSPDDVRAAFARAQDLTVVDGRFFWRQQVGTHKMYLSPAQIEAFYKVHGDKLRKFGY